MNDFKVKPAQKFVEDSGLHLAVLIFPFAADNIFHVTDKLIKILSSVSYRIFFVSGGIPSNIIWADGVQIRDIGVRLHYLIDRQPMWLSALSWIGKALVAQIRLAREVFRLRHQVDAVVFAFGSYYQLPLLVAKLLKKRVLCLSTGLDALNARVNYGKAMENLVRLLTWFTFSLSDAVLAESDRLGEHEILAPFRSKLYNGALYLDDSGCFQAKTAVQERENLVGYIGRLTTEKGVVEFVRAIPLALKKQPNLRFLIIGRGRLDGAIEQALNEQPWASKVTWLRWIEHERIPEYLNQLKLIVVPSYSEGLPNIVLEAMACRTPVLATRVGGIPDLVVDGKTGFMLRDSQPDTIAQGIIRAISDPRLEGITEKANALIRQNYNIDAAIRRYKDILSAVF